MKKVSKLLLILVILGLGFNSCEEVEIPGMGDSTEKLEAEPYDFNEDLVFSPLIGVDRGSLKSAPIDNVIIEGVAQGSGDQIIITFTITNTSDEWRSAYIRAGTVFEVNLEGYQNGISLAPIVICLSPGEQRIVTLYLYCLNLGKSDSDNSASYTILGVTESPKMLELVNALQGKMVNYEDYMIYYGDGAASAYDDVKDRLQEIIWHITNGDGMTNEDKAYINTLPELPQYVLPDGIYDLGFVLPASWCEGCGLETAFGGATLGEGSGAWWFYYDAAVGGQQGIYAGQYKVAGAYVEYVGGEIIIELGDRMRLIDDDEAVKIQGYNTLPEKRPAAGQFTTYKGTDLTVEVNDYPYYVIHLDVILCD